MSPLSAIRWSFVLLGVVSAGGGCAPTPHAEDEGGADAGATSTIRSGPSATTGRASPAPACTPDNGGCGNPAFFRCEEQSGGAPLCTPIDVCSADNGGCGDPAFYSCAHQPGAPPLCTPIDLCSADNGGCGDPAFYGCAAEPGAPPLCTPIDLCSADNGGCGDPAFYLCENQPGALPSCTELDGAVVAGGTVSGIVSGLEQGATATVVLGNDAYVASQRVLDGQSYSFTAVPDGNYFLKLEVSGHRAPPPFRVLVSSAAPPSKAAPSFDFATERLPDDAFRFHWEDDDSRAGVEQTAYINQPHTVVEIAGSPTEAVDLASADILAHDYNIVLSDGGEPWTQELASRLLRTERQLPQTVRGPYDPQTLTPSRWVLTKASVAGDIQVTRTPDGNEVLISSDAFVYADPRLVLLDGVRGTFYSKRLHHALTRYVTRDGADLAAVEKILGERFGCTTLVPDMSALTAATTAETASSFQPFHPDELLALLDLFEEMPRGYHVVHGLKYVVRRKDGTHNPRYPGSAAVAWALPDLFPDGSYLEFMETAFTADPTETHRLILHEKSHFLWAYVFSQELRDDWTALGGWYPDPSDPNGWSTTKETEFVSAYAHLKNPDEDMAESIAFFVLDPDALRSRSLAKYEFIRDRIMHGTQFLAHIQSELTFEVLNLYPDYDYPGKIHEVDIAAIGAPEEDKEVTIEVGLHTAEHVFAGAELGNLRVFSSIGTYVDVWLYPVDATGSVLRGSFTLSKYAKSGAWYTEQITLVDAVGNQRMEGLEDFGWKLYIDNRLEDVVPPTYVPGSLGLEVIPDVVSENGVDHAVQWVRATWNLVEAGSMPAGNGCYAALTNPSAPSQHALEAWGDTDGGTERCTVDFLVTEYRPSGIYGVPSIIMVDTAGNRTIVTFADPPAGEQEPLVSVPVTTPNADTAAPEVALAADAHNGLHPILVSAAPLQPNDPDGGTVVHIDVQARDDKSGLWFMSYVLLDPQGLNHFFYYYPPCYGLEFCFGDPAQWTDYAMSVVLPPGSAPGTWGLAELVAYDKAGNRLALDFVETLEFDLVP